MAGQLVVGQGLPTDEASRSHSVRYTTLWKSDQPVVQTSTWQHTTLTTYARWSVLTTDKRPCPRPQTHAL